MMDDMIKGLHHVAIKHLRKTATAHKAVMEGVATHAQKERVLRETLAKKVKLRETLSRPLGAPDQPLYADRAVLRDDVSRLLAGNMVGRAGGALLLD